MFTSSGSYLATIAVDHDNSQQAETFTWTVTPEYCDTEQYKVRVKCSYFYQGFTGAFSIKSAPTLDPTALPSPSPSAAPTLQPSSTPSRLPTRLPTKVPASGPTEVPVAAPTGVPLGVPTPAPTDCFLSACPAGFSCDGGNWTECTAGRFSPVGATRCQKCQAGRYTTTAASGSCTTCPAGYACQDPSSQPVVCSPGSYALGNETACKACPAGRFFC